MAGCTVLLGPLCRYAVLAASSGGPEKVGYLLGAAGEGVVKVYALVHARNLRGSSVEFEADPRDTLTAHMVAENTGLEVVGVFHTHPCGEPAPSWADLEGMMLWPLVWVIASPSGVGAFKIVEGRLARCRLSCS